jgi:hypothetical protein
LVVGQFESTGRKSYWGGTTGICFIISLSLITMVLNSGRGFGVKPTVMRNSSSFGGRKKRTSAAKAGYGSVVYGTAEAMPFQGDRVLTQTLKPLRE